jgi:hypothetical protein
MMWWGEQRIMRMQQKPEDDLHTAWSEWQSLYKARWDPIQVNIEVFLTTALNGDCSPRIKLKRSRTKEAFRHEVLMVSKLLLNLHLLKIQKRQLISLRKNLAGAARTLTTNSNLMGPVFESKPVIFSAAAEIYFSSYGPHDGRKFFNMNYPEKMALVINGFIHEIDEHIARLPRRSPAGRRESELVRISAIKIVPLLLEYCQIEASRLRNSQMHTFLKTLLEIIGISTSDTGLEGHLKGALAPL